MITKKAYEVVGTDWDLLRFTEICMQDYKQMISAEGITDPVTFAKVEELLDALSAYHHDGLLLENGQADDGCLKRQEKREKTFLSIAVTWNDRPGYLPEWTERFKSC